jgi:hypothetical protein
VALTPQPGGSPDGAPPWSTWLRDHGPFVLLLLAAIGLRVHYFNRFYVPDTDFFAFKETAQAFLTGHPPDSYQRLPLYSLLMSAAFALSGGHISLLFAAEVINLLCALAAAILLYLLAHRFVGPAALVVVYLFAFDPLSYHMTAEPRNELLATTLLILACYLSVTTRQWGASIAAGLAALTRYEAALLIPGLLLRDLRIGPRWAALSRSAVASAGLLVWLLANYLASGHLNPYHAYVGEATHPAGTAFVRVMLTTVGSFIKLPIGSRLSSAVVGGIVLGLAAVGLANFARRFGAEVLPLAGFLVAGTALNMAFFSPTPEHAFLLIWILYLAGVGGFCAIATALASRWHGRRAPRAQAAPKAGPPALAIAWVGLAALLVMAGFLYGATPASPFGITAAASLAWAALANTRRSARNAPAVSLLVLGLGVMTRQNVPAIEQRMERARYVKAELRLVGEWAAGHLEPGERIAVSEPSVAAFYAGPRREAFVGIAEALDSSGTRLADAMVARGVNYVAWNSHHGRGDPGSFYYKRYRMDLVAPLGAGRDTDALKLVTTLRAGSSVAYIYGLKR